MPDSPLHTQQPILAGEMGGLIGSRDWSHTSLGPIETWPAPLRIALDIVLHSRFPMFLWWGPDLCCFYNDAGTALLAGTDMHPRILGMPAKEAWAEIWDSIGPIIAQVQNSNEATWHENLLVPLHKPAHTENTYWTLSCSPVHDELGRAAGILSTCTDTSGHVLSMQQAAESERRFRSLVNGAAVATSILEGPDFVIALANDEALKLWGKDRSVIGKTVIEAMPELEGQPYIKILEDVYYNGKTYEGRENLVYHEKNGERVPEYVNFVYRPMRNTSGEIYAILNMGYEVTEHVITRNKITDAEERMRLAVDSAELGTFDVNLGASEVICSERFCDIFGLPYTGLDHEQLIARIHPDDRELRRTAHALAMKTGQLQYDARVVRPDRTMRWVSFQGMVYKDARNQPARILGIAKDITEQVRARLVSEELEARATLAIESTRLGTYDIDFSTGKALFSARMLEIYGRQDEPATLEALNDSVHPDDRHIPVDAMEAARRNGFANYEMRILWPDLSVHWVKVLGRILMDEHGKPVRISGTVRDITDEQAHTQELRESEEKFRNTVMQAPVGITILRGPNRIVEMANKTYLEIVDKTEQEFVGKSLYDSLTEVKEAVEPLLRGVTETGKSFHGFEFPVMLNRFGKLEQTYFNFIYQALRESDGSISGVIVVANEVTSQVNARLRLQESEEQFRHMIMHSPIAMTVLKGEDFIIENANETLLNNIWKRRLDEVLGKRLLDVFPELDNQKYPELLRKVLRTGEPHREFESVAYVVNNGKPVKYYLDFEYAALRTPDGRPSGLLITVYDVTEKVNAREQVKAAEERVRLATEGTQVATWDIDIVTGQVVHSPQLALIFGYPENSRLTHEELLDHYDKDDRENILKRAYEEALKTGIYFYEARIRQVDGSAQWVRTQGKLFYDEHGAPQRMVGTLINISEQKRAEQELNRLASIVKSSDDAIISKRLDGIIVSWNDSAQRIFGYTPEEIVGKSVYMLIPKDRTHEEVDIIARLNRGERIEHFETQRVTKDGRLIDLSLSISPLKDTDGKVIGASKIARDITQHRAAQRLIAENEERLKIVMDASELGSWELNLANNEFSYSPRYRQMLGFGEGDDPIAYDNFVRHLHPDDLAIRAEAFKEAYVTGQLHYTTRIVWEDHSVHWLEARGKVFYDAHKKPQKIIGTVRDITADRTYRIELEENEKKFRLLADSMPQHIWTSDAEGNLNYFNQSVYDYTGLEPGDVRLRGWLHIIHPDDREENVKRWMSSVKTGEPFLFEHRFRRHDGEYRWQLSRAIPQRNIEGQITMWVGTSTDIHEQKTFSRELESKVLERTRDLQQANDALEKMNQELASFAYVSSHDLQEPLRKIQTFATRILEKEKQNLSAAGQDYFNRMQGAASRMQQLIEDLLAYSRTNTSEKIFERTDLNVLLADVKSDLEQSIRDKKAGLNIGPMPVADIIPYQFRQLFTNIISNSLKFTKPDVPPRIEVKAEEVSAAETGWNNAVTGQQYYHFTVSDNGIGFAPEYAGRIFEVFQRLHGRSEYEGTGIGLAICKRIVENHNGYIKADSQPGQGAVFHVYVPVL